MYNQGDFYLEGVLMFQKLHNDNSKKFMQKVLLFIDNVITESSNSDDSNKVLVSGILSVRDAIFSEIVRDNQIDQISAILAQQEAKKKEQENQKDLGQETKSASDQSV